MIELDDDAHDDYHRRRQTIVDHTTEVDSTDSRSTDSSEKYGEGLALFFSPLLLLLLYGTFVEGMETVVIPLMTWMNTTLVGNVVMVVVALTAFGVVGAFLEE